MAVTDQQKLDFLLKKIGYTKTKTGSVVGTGAISGTPKQPFAEAIPSPLIIANGALWNEADSIPTTPPGADTTQVKVYLAATSGLRMTADATSSGQRAYIAYSTYGNTSSTRLTNWIDTQFGASYIIKVYKGDPNSGGVNLSAAGSGQNDGWFFDYSAGVLNFNDTNVPSGVTDTNIYIVGYRYIGQTGAPTSGISTFSYLDLTVERNLDVGVQGGISTFRNNIDLNADLDVDGHTNLDNVSIAGVSTFAGITTVTGNTFFAKQSNVSGISTFASQVSFAGGTRITGSGNLLLGNTSNNNYLSLHNPNPSYSKFSFNGSQTIIQSLNQFYVNVWDGNGYENFIGIHGPNSSLSLGGDIVGATRMPKILISGHTSGNKIQFYSSSGTSNNERFNLVDSGITITGLTTFVGNIDANGDLDVDGHTNLDNISVAGVSTFTGDATFSGNVSIGGTLTYEDVTNVDSVGLLTARSGIRVTGGVIEALAGENKIPSLYANLAALPSASTYHGMFAHVHSTGRGYFAHAGNWLELVNKDTSGNVGLSGDLDVDGHTNLDNVSISGVTTTAGNVDINAQLDVSGQASLSGFTTTTSYGLTTRDLYTTGITTVFKSFHVEGREANNDGLMPFVVKHGGYQGIQTSLFTASLNNYPELVLENRWGGNWNTTQPWKLKWTSPNESDAGPAGDGRTLAELMPSIGNAGNLGGFRLRTTDGSTGLKSVFSLNAYNSSFYINNSSGTHTALRLDAVGVGITNYIYHYGNIPNDTNTRFGFAGNHNIAFDTDGTQRFRIQNSASTFSNNIVASADLDVDGHTNLDNVSIAGVTTFAGNIIANGSIDLSGDLDVDGHTNLDNVNIVGVTTTTDNIHIGTRTHTANSSTALKNIHMGSEFWNGTAGDHRALKLIVYGTSGSANQYGLGVSNSTLELQSNSHIAFFAGGVSGNTKTRRFYITSGGDYLFDSGTLYVQDKIGHYNDANTNIRFPSNDTISFETAGTQRLNIASNGNISVTNDLDVDGHTNLDNVSVAGVTTFAANTRFNSSITAGGGTGTNGQYLKTTGSGVEWATFPSLRTRQTFTASAGQTTFTFNYTVTFLDVFVNGIKLTDDEFTATNGTSVVLAVGCFVGDIVELVSYNTVSAGGGASGIGNVVEDISPQLGGNLDLFSKTINGTGGISITGVVTATTFIGDGSGLTGIVASGSGVVIKHDGSTVGTAGTINFGSNLDVTPISSGIVTVTAAAGGGSTAEVRANTLSVIGISTFTGNIDANGDLDVDGHTNLDNVSIVGVATLTSGSNQILFNTDNGGIEITRAVGGPFIDFKNSAAEDYDVRIQSSGVGGSNIHMRSSDGTGALLGYANNSYDLGSSSVNWRHLYVTSVNAGVITATTFKGAIEATSASFSSNIDANGDLDVDGHTNLDNVSVAGVTTFSQDVIFDGATAGRDITFDRSVNRLNFADNADLTFGNNNDLILVHNGNHSLIQDAGTGNLSILSNSLYLQNTSGNETYLRALDNTGALDLYHNNEIRLSTTSDGISIPKDLDVDGHTNLDNISVAGVSTFANTVDITNGTLKRSSTGNQLIFYADNETRLYHTSNAQVKLTFYGTGEALRGSIDANASNIQIKDSGGRSGVVVVHGAESRLYFNDVEKLRTTNTGAVVSGILTATSFSGDGSGLTGITASGSGVVVQHDGSTVGTAGTINFGTNLDVSAISAGIVTVTASGGGSGSGISTISGVVNIANDLDVDGHTNLDNVSIAGVTTLTSSSQYPLVINGSDNGKIVLQGSSNPYIRFRQGTTDKAFMQFHSNGQLEIYNQETSRSIRIKSGSNGLIFNEGGTERIVWHAGNDGSGSTLDADLLDGQEGSYYSPNVGITTNLSGTFTASAGSPSTINTFGYGSGDIVVEYTVFIKNGSNYQSQKLLAMRDGTTIHSTQFAIMYSSSLLVQLDATISSGNILLRATPETGVSGDTTYKIKREVM